MDGSPQSRNRPLLAQFITDPYVWVLALVPCYLLLASSNWIFSKPLSIDPWVYHGYFRNLQEYKAVFFHDTYYGSRLSWILPGYLAYKFLPPLAANYLLHLGLWYAAVFALYYTLKTTASRQVGLLAAVFLGSYYYFLVSVGSDYVDGPANVYFLVCLGFLTAAARGERNRITLILAGVALAAAVYANLFAILFAPVVLLYFALLSWRSRGLALRGGLTCLSWLLLGSAALTALLGCANYLIEGSFQFYQPSIDFVRATIGKPNPWKLPLAQWIPQTWRLAPPAAVAAAALLALANRRFRGSLAGPAAASAFLLAFVLMILCEWMGLPVLQYSYYASYLIPTMLLAIGALLANSAERLQGLAVIPAALAVLLVNSIPLWGYNPYVPVIKASARPGLLLLFAALFAVCPLLRAASARWGLVAALIALNLLSISSIHGFEDRHAARDSFTRISQAAGTVDAVRRGEPIRFWYRKKDPHSAEFNALNAIYLWKFTMIGDNFPEILPSAMYHPGSLVAIPSSEDNLFPEANEALKQTGLAAEFLERYEIHDEGVRYSVSFVRVAFDYSQLHPRALQPCAVKVCRNLVAASAPEKLPLDGWIASEYPGLQSSMEHRADGIQVTTAPAQSGKASLYGPLVPDASGLYLFRLRFGLLAGRITFGALSGDMSRTLAQALMPAARPSGQTALLSLKAEAGEPFWLVIANNHPGGDHASSYLIRDLEAYLFPAEKTGAHAQSANP
jgi:hypothetical protein